MTARTETDYQQNEDELPDNLEDEPDHYCLNCGMKNYPQNHICSDY